MILYFSEISQELSQFNLIEQENSKYFIQKVQSAILSAFQICQTGTILNLSIIKLDNSLTYSQLLKDIIQSFSLINNTFTITTPRLSEFNTWLLKNHFVEINNCLHLQIDLKPISVNDATYQEYNNYRQEIYVSELKQMSLDDYNKINFTENVTMYQILLNNKIIGGCRVELTPEYTLIGKIFILLPFRSCGVCTFMMKQLLAIYVNQKLSIWSYAHLQDYYKQFGFQPQKWFIPDLCMIMLKDN